MKRLFTLFILFFSLSAIAEEPLSADEAFQLTTTVEDAETLLISWEIAEGYYLYEERFAFRSNTPGITLASIALPPAKVKYDDAFEKEVGYYRHQVTARLTLERAADAPDTLELAVRSQGCADIGVCYPPQPKKLTIELPPAEGITGTPLAPLMESGSGQSSLLDNLGGVDELLPVEEAFQPSLELLDGNTLSGTITIAPGTYLYQDSIKLELLDAAVLSVGELQLPEGEEKYDEAFEKTLRVFHDSVTFSAPLQGDSSGAEAINVRLHYQGCAEIGVCYPPQKPVFPFSLTGEAEAGDSLFMEAMWFLGGGLLLAFTACMYPMIPILSSIIVGQGEKASAWRGFTLSAIYVLAVATTFGVIGAITGSAFGGVGIQAYFQSPWLLIPFALLFVVLSLAMFGFYNIQMPSAIQSRLTTFSNRQQGGTFIGVAIMGSLSALIIGPCGGPILAAALTYAVGSGSGFNGFVALFALGLGMGLPLLLLGIGGGSLLPRAGNWMGTVKAVAGVILLAVAITFLERIPSVIPPEATMLMWATLFIISAAYMGATDNLPEGCSGWRRLWKGVGLVLLIYGTLVMYGALTGSKNVLDPLQGGRSVTVIGTASAAEGQAATAAGQHGAFITIKTVADLQQQLAEAGARGKLVMLDFYADWCTYCKKYEEQVFSAPQLQARLGELVLLKADVTAVDDADRALMEQLGVMLPPALIFFDTSGNELSGQRVVGFLEPEEFLAHLDSLPR